jgi:hypothetical protein
MRAWSSKDPAGERTKRIVLRKKSSKEITKNLLAGRLPQTGGANRIAALTNDGIWPP